MVDKAPSQRILSCLDYRNLDSMDLEEGESVEDHKTTEYKALQKQRQIVFTLNLYFCNASNPAGYFILLRELRKKEISLRKLHNHPFTNPNTPN